MAKKRWYSKEEDVYIRQRIRQLQVLLLPYGSRTAAYEQIARELHRKFSVRRTWQGVQQRARIVLLENKEKE